MPAGRKNRWKSHPRSGRESFRSSPGLHQCIFWQIWIKNFVPPFHMFSMFGENHLNTLAKVGLQVVIIFYVVGAHPFLNFFVAIPIFSIDFVATDVKVWVRKQRSHFAQHAVQYLIGLFYGGINGWTNSVTHPANYVCPWRCRCAIGVSDQPAYCVPRNVKLWNHANATFTRVRE